MVRAWSVSSAGCRNWATPASGIAWHGRSARRCVAPSRPSTTSLPGFWPAAGPLNSRKAMVAGIAVARAALAHSTTLPAFAGTAGSLSCTPYTADGIGILLNSVRHRDREHFLSMTWMQDVHFDVPRPCGDTGNCETGQSRSHGRILTNGGAEPSTFQRCREPNLTVCAAKHAQENSNARGEDERQDLLREF